VAVAGLVAHDAATTDQTEDEIREIMGASPGLRPIGSGTVAARLWTKPSISVLAFDAPPVREAINQLVPVARAKVSLRIPPGQDPVAAADALRAHLLDNAPWGCDVTVTAGAMAPPFRLDGSSAVAAIWLSAMREVWGTEPVDMGGGGTIPLVALLSQRFPDVSIILTGAGDPTSSVHAPNESQDLGELRNSIAAQVRAISTLGG